MPNTETQDPPKNEAPPPKEDPIVSSFLLAGEDELNLEGTPTEEELEKSTQEEAERDYLESRSIGSLEVDESEQSEEPSNPDEGGDPPKEDPGPEGGKPKKKVKFKDPFEEEEEEQSPTPDAPQSPKEDDPPPQDSPKEEQTGITDEDREFVSKLPPEAQESIEFWRDAEQVDERYKGFAKKQIEYIKQHSAFTRKLRDDDPHTPLEENPKYVSWVKQNKPTITRAERRRLDREIVVHEAEKRLAEKQGKTLEEIQEWKRQQELEREHGPKIQERSSQFSSNLVNELEKVPGAEEPMKFFREQLEELKDPAAASQKMQEEYPDEAQIIFRNHQRGHQMASELLRLRSGISRPDLENNPIHKELASRIVAQEQAMMKPNMKDHRVREGKSFVPAAQLAQMKPEEREKHWTFSDREILNFLSRETLFRTQKELEKHNENVQRILSKYGKTQNRNQKRNESGQFTSEKQNNDDAPRHEGADSPSSTARASSGDESSSRADRLLNWDF